MSASGGSIPRPGACRDRLAPPHSPGADGRGAARKKRCRPCAERHLADIREEYRGAPRPVRSALLDEAVEFTGYCRGTAIRKLNGEPPPPRSPKPRPGRPPGYGRREEDALLVVREHLGCPGERKLVGGLPRALASLERDGVLAPAPDVRERLLAMSSATAGRIVRRRRSRRPPAGTARRPRGRLRTGTPLRTWGSWDEARPGELQTDTVFHSGSYAGGRHLYTLVVHDPATGWTEAEVLLRLRQDPVEAALDAIRARLPFPWTGFHSDNGSEFLNERVAAWCAERGIARTRGRPGKSGDQAHVEQRNRTFVRALAGDLRFEGAAARNALAALYAPAIDFANFFDARTRLLEKARSGRRVTKRYDRARTPHERLAGSGVLDPDGLRLLDERFLALSLARLRQEIDRGIDGLIRFAARPR